MKKYLKIYANGAKPVFIEDDKFHCIVPLSNPVFGDKAELVLSFTGLEIDQLSKGILDEMKQLALFPSLASISDPDSFLFQKGSSWAEKGVKLKIARIHKINNLRFDDFQKGSSWAEKGVKLLSKRTLTILKLLMICIAPVKIEEMKQILSFGSRDKLREIYLNPLRTEGLIETTVKDKPNSPEQHYVLSEKGRLFLGGFEIV